jgi:formate hydrogenlyase subunit 3/multisubunit Na+/H+ antiporter MnhD subunit
MTAYTLALCVFLAGALAALLRPARLGAALGCGAAILGCALGLAAAVPALFTPQDWTLAIAWPPPWGLGTLGIDAVSALFLTPAFLLIGLGAAYGRGYLGKGQGGASWFFYNILAAAIAGVFTARDPMLLLLSWEAMALSSYFLVCLEDGDAQVRRAGRIYLVASHLGAAFLLTFCLLPGATWPPDQVLMAGLPAGLLFLLALAGFGSKAGVAPLGVWLPEAHPAAPSHVSAVLSGVMIKTGVYGILRVLLTLHPEPWWGWTLIGLGGATAVFGVAGALAQGELKRLLAWSSMENAGVMLLALGMGALGRAYDAPLIAALGFGAALTHVVNHGVLKGLLFFCAGGVLHATGERRMDRLGGLLGRMPSTGAAFLVGALGICGLPPLGGFASELTLGLCAIKALLLPVSALDIPALLALAALVLSAAMAAAAFSGAFGVIFLGAPRGEAVARAHESGPAMRLSTLALAGIAPLLGLASPWVLRTALSALDPFVPGASVLGEPTADALQSATYVFALVYALLGGLLLLRRALLSGRSVRRGPTWDCGYALPTARIQYTYSSFTQPLVEMFHALTGRAGAATRPWGLFPARAGYVAESEDHVLNAFLAFFGLVDRKLEALHHLQQGQVHVYVLYIAATLVGLLAWGLA